MLSFVEKIYIKKLEIMKQPLVSIILSTYNWSKYIKESINSVLKQTYSNFEFIIINDYSTDKVEEIILDFQKKDNRIKYSKNKINLKLTKSLNKWIGLSKWEYIARIDDDDIWTETKLDEQVKFMENNLDYWLCWTSMVDIDENWDENTIHIMRTSNENINNHFLQSNQFAHSSVIIRKSILDIVWGYNNEWNLVEDYELWLRIWKVSKLYNFSNVYLKYRVLENSLMRKRAFKRRYMAFKVSLKNRKNYPNFKKSFLLRIPHLLLSDKIFWILLKAKFF